MKHALSAALMASLAAITSAQADEKPPIVMEWQKAAPADFMDAFGTRVFPNEGPCTPANAPSAGPDMSGRYIGLYPGGDVARSWDISVQLDGTRSLFTLGAGSLPLVYGITGDGAYMVRTHGMATEESDDTYVFQGLFPIWGVMLEQKWACYYLPGYPPAR